MSAEFVPESPSSLADIASSVCNIALTLCKDGIPTLQEKFGSMRPRAPTLQGRSR